MCILETRVHIANLTRSNLTIAKHCNVQSIPFQNCILTLECRVVGGFVYVFSFGFGCQLLAVILGAARLANFKVTFLTQKSKVEFKLFKIMQSNNQGYISKSKFYYHKY